MPAVSYGSPTDCYWIGGASDYDWNMGTNWNPNGPPAGGDNAYLMTTDSLVRDVTYSALDPAPVLNELRIDATGAGTITLHQGSYSLSAGTAYIGYQGTGSLVQTGGTSTIANTLYLGSNPGSTGSYNLSGAGALSTGGEQIGGSGTGTFTQTGGTNAASSLYVGTSSGSTGTFTQTGGTTNITGDEAVGYSGQGEFTQTGGTNTVTGTLRLGYNSGATGTYDLSDTGALSAYRERIGNSGAGTFTQTGGTNTVTDNLSVGRNSGSSGLYSLSGAGTLSAGTETVGDSGSGAFTQTGGINTMTGTLYLGASSNSTGTYNLSGTGALSCMDEMVGFQGSGTFIQTGGTHTVTHQISVGGALNATGSYSLSGTGTLSTTYEVIGNAGAGTFSQTGGTNTAQYFYLASNSASTGTYDLRGTGTLSASTEYIGYHNIGIFNQTGGTNRITGSPGRLLVGAYSYPTSSSTGTYNLSGTGALFAPSEVIGNSGTGTFTQTGGTNTTDTLYVGMNPEGTGTYNLGDPAVLTTGSTYVGNSGTGAFNQTGGTHTTNYLGVGSQNGSTGTFSLKGGVLSAGTETVGDSGSGAFTQTGGTNITNTLTVKASTTAHGTYNLSGGTLNAGTILNNDQFNYSGGTLNGSFTNNTGATFTLSGAGTRTVNGDVTNWGTVKVAGTTDGTTAVFTGTFLNKGVLNTDPATLEFLGDLIIGPGGSIQASGGDQYILHQGFTVDSSAAASGWTTSGADLIFTGAGPHDVSLGGFDVPWNQLFLDSGVSLDFSGTGTFYAALLSGLTTDNGTITNISASAGFSLFYDPVLNPGLSGIYQLSGGGSLDPLTPVPLPGAGLLGVLGLSVAGWRLRRKPS